MARDGKLLAAARGALRERRADRERELTRRESEVFKESPQAARINRDIQRTMQELFASALNRDATDAEVTDIKTRNLALQDELRGELVRAGIAPDYLDDKPYCGICNDTGNVGAQTCVCLNALYDAEQRRALSDLLSLGDASFEAFRLDYYDGDARVQMGIVFDVCKQYAQTFGRESDNLFLTGAPGLGKTFLSACIARVVSERGYSVVYDNFSSIFAKLEDEKFRRNESETTLEDARRLRECDLLIADDLGTEMMTTFTSSALYELVNTRLVRGKKTIISSNLSPEELYRRYSPQIASRLAGEYFALKFVGSDIRLKKREM